MSYSLVRSPFSLSALGISIPANSVAAPVKLPSCDITTGSAAADAAFKKCCEGARGQLSSGVSLDTVSKRIARCSTAALESAAKEKTCGAVTTGIYYIDQGFKTCCEVAWKSTGNVGQRTKKLAECTANAVASSALTGYLAAGATALCVAAGAATAGITTALAATGVCGLIGGTVGSFLYNRVSGYSTQSLVLGAAAAAVCGTFSGGALAIACGFAVAELVEWISDAVGPLLEDIFNPDAAEKRRRAERRAIRAVRNAVENSVHEAEAQITEQWKATINRIWDLYETLLPSDAQRAAALAAMGISNNYQSIALALIAAARHFPAKWEIDKYGGYDAAIAALAKGTGGGFHFTILDRADMARRAASHTVACEIYGRPDASGNFGPSSAICPPLVWNEFMAQEDSPAKRTADYYRKLGADYGVMITDFFALLPMAETYVSTTITTFATVRRLDDLKKAADQAVATKNEAKLAATAVAAAKSAELAADAAKSWSGKTRERALVSVQLKYDVAKHARFAVTFTATPGSATSIVYQKKANAAVSRAAAAVKLAQSNARTAQLMVGGTAALGVAGIGYLMFRRST